MCTSDEDQTFVAVTDLGRVLYSSDWMGTHTIIGIKLWSSVRDLDVHPVQMEMDNQGYVYIAMAFSSSTEIVLFYLNPSTGDKNFAKIDAKSGYDSPHVGAFAPYGSGVGYITWRYQSTSTDDYHHFLSEYDMEQGDNEA
jgi:hypothetical protein